MLSLGPVLRPGMATSPTTARGPFPTLETPRLILREIRLDDAEFWLRNFSDPEVVELTAYEPPRDLEAAKAEIVRFVIRLFEEGAGFRWGITLRGHPELIGTLGYHQWHREGGGIARVGYELLREHRRQGIMSEALGAILDYGFGPMGLHRVEALTDPVNTASRRLLGSLGFREEGVLRENTAFRGRFIDDVVYALLAREWRAARYPNR